MLGVKNYTQTYIDECRSRVNVQLSTYNNLITSARKSAGNNEKSLNSAIESFEPIFFNNMVLLLDALFVHRLRMIEGKDGNPLNEVLRGRFSVWNGQTIPVRVCVMHPLHEVAPLGNGIEGMW